MIPAWKVQAIEALLAEDALSQRAIAKRLQVGRGVVAGIANGTRPDYHALRQAKVPPPPAAATHRALPRVRRDGSTPLPCLPRAAGAWSTAAAGRGSTCWPPAKGSS